MTAPGAHGLRVWVQGIGLLGPGLASWAASQGVLRGRDVIGTEDIAVADRATRYVAAPTVLPAPARLPPAERRRAGAAVKLALAVADEAVAQARLDPSALATVFTSSSGEGTHCHALCETLATAAPMVSPTRFTNSVHNAASGCWHIAVGSRAASTSLCAFDGSFGAGLLEAATSVAAGRAPVLLVASDSPYPEPLHAVRPLPDHFGLALLLAPERDERSIAALTITLEAEATPTACDDPALDALRRTIPAAAALPLLIALAGHGGAQHETDAAPRRVVLEYLRGLWLAIEVVDELVDEAETNFAIYSSIDPSVDLAISPAIDPTADLP